MTTTEEQPREAMAAQIEALAATEKWLRECSDWLLANNLDMRCPMQADPLDLADNLPAIVTALRQAEAAPGVVEVKRLRKFIQYFVDQAKMANDVIALNRDGQGQGRVKVATVMHRIEHRAREALATASPPIEVERTVADGAEDEKMRRFRHALQDIADAEPIPNDAVAFVWCRDVAKEALIPAAPATDEGERK